MSVLFISLFVLALDEKARAITITIYYVIVIVLYIQFVLELNSINKSFDRLDMVSH